MPQKSRQADNSQSSDVFYWGASTAAHQIEGGNNNDWSRFEQADAVRLSKKFTKESAYGNGSLPEESWRNFHEQIANPENYISGDGVDFWHTWKQDIKLLHELGLNSFRLSIEWSRIFPTPGDLNIAALKKYVQIVRELQKNNIHPFITLHHFTNPLWVVDAGGWENPETARHFAEYVEVIATAFEAIDDIHWCIFNEPEVYILMNCVQGSWPSERKSLRAALKVRKNFIGAHKTAYGILKKYNGNWAASTSLNMATVRPKKNIFLPINWMIARTLYLAQMRLFMRPLRKHLDFIAIQQYMDNVVSLHKQFQNPPTQPRSDLGWYLNPNSIAELVQDLSRYGKPVIVTEHGLADANDTRRAWYIEESLSNLLENKRSGSQLAGYLHWSLLDNFEWEMGWWPQFGLYAVDRKTQARSKRASATTYADIIKNSQL